MAGLTHGMDVEGVRALAGTFGDAATRLQRLAGTADRSAGRAAGWVGPDAARFRSTWPQHRAALLRIASELEDQATRLGGEADDQLRASGGGSVRTLGEVCLTPQGFLARLAALTGDADAVPPGHIGLIRNGDGTYVVILPGVEDLTSSGEAIGKGYRAFSEDLLEDTPEIIRRFPGFVPVVTVLSAPAAASAGVANGLYEAFGRRDSYRDLTSTGPTAFGPARGDDAYAARVHRALRDAGVPDGAKLMLVGHSGGGYAGASAALSPTFNSNAGAGGSYDVTHVLSLAADTGHFGDRMPDGTSFVPVNNTRDVVVAGEAVLTGWSHGGPGADERFWSGWGGGSGHEPSHYSTYLSSGDHSRDLRGFAAGASATFDPGTGAAVETLSVGLD